MVLFPTGMALPQGTTFHNQASYYIGEGYAVPPQGWCISQVKSSMHRSHMVTFFQTLAPSLSRQCQSSFSYCGLALPSRELGCVAGGKCKVWRHYIPKGPVLRAQQPKPCSPSPARTLSSSWKASGILALLVERALLLLRALLLARPTVF